MTMTNEEICRDYRTAKSKLKQIQILAELNECSKDTIKRILVEGGEKLPGNMVAPGERKAKPKPEPKTEPEEATTAPMDANTGDAEFFGMAITLIADIVALSDKCGCNDIKEAVRDVLRMCFVWGERG